MVTTRLIKINFQGDSRDVTLPRPVTLVSLQGAVSSTFGADLLPRSGKGAAEDDLCFTYKDPEGDDIVFDKEYELSLALRLCPTLEISAVSKAERKVMTFFQKPSNVPQDAHDPDKIYRVATRNLRQNHGVSHMTPEKLIKTLTLLKLSPRRLVVEGLAPRKLLAAAIKTPRVPLGDKRANEDLVGTARADVELMTFEGEEKKNDGANNTAEGKAPPLLPKMSIRAALLAADVALPPCEVRPLLSALKVHPHRFVKLGLVDAHNLHNNPVAGAPGGRGPGGRGRGRGPPNLAGRGRPHGRPRADANVLSQCPGAAQLADHQG